MRLKVKYPNSTKIITLSNTTLESFFNAIFDDAPIVESIKYGFPRRTLCLDDTSVTLESLGIKTDQQIIVTPGKIEDKTLTSQVAGSFKADSHGKTKKPNAKEDTQGLLKKRSRPQLIQLAIEPYGYLCLRVMKDDNSCMFRAVSYTVLHTTQTGNDLRKIVSSAVKENSDIYTDAILGKKRLEYMEWIEKSTSWGGAIELEILAQYFGITIYSLDVANLRIDEYNPGKPRFVLLIYSGIHYDAVSLVPDLATDGNFENDITIFEEKEISEIIMGKFRELGKILNSNHYYTDTSKFTLKCFQCGKYIVGEKDAIQHVKSTGHSEFGEY